MIGYLLDTSALWHLLRSPSVRQAWEGHIASGVVSICEATRAEFLYSATGPAHRDELAADVDSICLLSPIPKTAWHWVDAAQYKLTQKGQHRAAGPIDLLVCAVAVYHGLTVLHVDSDFATVADVVSDVRQRDIRV